MLEVYGDNWPIFKRKFKTYIDGIGLDEHFQKSNAPAKSYEDIKVKLIKEGVRIIPDTLD